MGKVIGGYRAGEQVPRVTKKEAGRTGKIVATARWKEGEEPKITLRKGADLTIEQRVQQHLEDGTHTLHICPNAWALRRRLVNEATGEVARFGCGLWSCAYCGPRKVDRWRQIIAQADPKLHLVLTKAGHTVEEASRKLTTFMQALRRGSKGRGRGRIGARPAYPVEYLAVLEEHKDFERNGFHWHILISGVDYIPYKEVIRPLWTSAIKGKRTEEEALKQEYGFSDEEVRAFLSGEGKDRKKFRRLGWIKPVEKVKAIGYVTKYLMKDIFKERKGIRRVERVQVVGLLRDEQGELVRDEQGKLIEDRLTVIDEVESKARRIRYSRGFFPEPTKQIWRRLLNPTESTQEGGEQGNDDAGQGDEERKEQQAASLWKLVEVAPPAQNVEEYQERVVSNLTWAVRDYVDTGKRLSFRVLRMWEQHRVMHERPLEQEPLSEQLRQKWLYQMVQVDNGQGERVTGLVTEVSRQGDIRITLPDDEQSEEQPTIFLPAYGGDKERRGKVVKQLCGLRERKEVGL
jgi:hypothetical protein